MGRVHRLSKSRFTTGLQCHRQLWWRVHEPAAPELIVGPDQQAVFDQGTSVGRLARGRFPGGTLIDLPHDAYAERIATTKAALASTAPALFEASFIADDTFVAVDVLERVEGGWRLIEVKSSTRVKPEHIPDTAVQLHVLRSAGLSVNEVQIMHLNRECVYPDLDDLFVRTAVTDQAVAFLDRVPGAIRAQLAMLAAPLPEAPIGPHCDSPYECPFKRRCWAHLPPDNVTTLYYVGSRKWTLLDQGIERIVDLPEPVRLHPAARRQRRALIEHRVIVEPGLRAALDHLLISPLAVIDFETVGLAVPAWRGCRPFDAVPAQFSCHAEDGSGGWRHAAWLADGPEDPRPELMRRLAEACEDARTIVAWNAPFERACLERVARDHPTARSQADSITSRLVDALPLLRDHVYHPAFGGSFSLKAVLPALAPELSYEGLAIEQGTAASREIARLLLNGDDLPAAERERTRTALLTYCERDTRGTVRLIDGMRELAAGLNP